MIQGIPSFRSDSSDIENESNYLSVDFHADRGVVNPKTGSGTKDDPSVYARTKALKRLSDVELENLYLQDIPGKIADFYPVQATSEGIRINAEKTKTPEFIGWITKQLEKLDFWQSVRKAMIFANIYGGAVIILDIDDGRPYSEPVDVANIQAIKGLIVKDRTHITPEFDNVFSDVSKPSHYRLNMATSAGVSDELRTVREKAKDQGLDLIHSSRVLRFDGVTVPDRLAAQNHGWGYSVFYRIRDSYLDFEEAYSQLLTMLVKFEIPVVKIQNLVGKLANSKDGESALMGRMNQLKQSWRNMGMLVSDKEHEDIELVTRTITGIPEVIDRFTFRLVGSTHIPENFLMMRSSKGQGLAVSTWERYYTSAHTLSIQEQKLRRPVTTIIEYLLSGSPYAEEVGDGWSFEFKSTFKLTPEEHANIKKIQSVVDSEQIETGVVSAEEVRLSRHSGSRWSPETILMDAEAGDTPSESRSDALIDQIDRTVPDSVKRALRQGIKKHEAGLSGDGLEAATVREAKALIRGELPFINKIKKGYRFTVRNRRFADEPKDSAAGVSWLLWGSDAGMRFWRKLYNQILKAEGKEPVAARRDGELIGYHPMGESFESHLDALDFELNQ